MGDKLKPCPFCGDSASIDRMGTNRVSMQISCDNCGCYFESGETWIDENSSWNKRDSDRLVEENAELRNAMAELVNYKGILTSDNPAMVKAMHLLDSADKDRVMKTYETEKHNIPEGATHYFNETSCDFFAWWDWDDVDKLMLTPDRNIGWDDRADASGDIMHPIPQTKEVEWVNGDAAVISKSSKSKWFVVGVSPVTDTSTICVSNTGELKSFHTNQLKKPETQEDREKREELESAYDLYCELNANHNCVGFDRFKNNCENWIRVVRKTGYRKGGE